MSRALAGGAHQISRALAALHNGPRSRQRRAVAAGTVSVTVSVTCRVSIGVAVT